HHRKRSLGDSWNGLAVRTDQCSELRDLAALSQAKADQPRDDEQKHRQQLEEGSEDAATPGDLFVGSPQSALYNILVGTPVPEADDWGAEEHSQPRIVPVEIPGLLH